MEVARIISHGITELIDVSLAGEKMRQTILGLNDAAQELSMRTVIPRAVNSASFAFVHFSTLPVVIDQTQLRD